MIVYYIYIQHLVCLDFSAEMSFETFLDLDRNLKTNRKQGEKIHNVADIIWRNAK